VSYKITFAFQFLPVALSASIYPVMSSWMITNREKIGELFVKAWRYLFLIVFPLTFGLGAIAEPLIVKLYGADTLRMYELFLGPHEQAVTWNSRGIVGVRRFLEKVWRIASSVIPSASGQVLRYSEGSRDSSASTPQNDKLNSVLHKTIKKVTEDIVNFRFNTAVSALMILANEIEGKEINRNEVETLLKLLAPFAPHMTEELWHGLGNKTSIHLEPWPEYDEDLIKEDVMSIAVQVNGKHRSTVKVVATATEDHVKEIALADPNVKKHLEGKEVRKVIYVPEKIINFVI